MIQNHSTSLSIQNPRINPSRIHFRPFWFSILHNHFIFLGETKYSNCSSSRSFKIMWLGESLPADCSWCKPKYEHYGLFHFFWWYRCHRLQSQCCWSCTKFGHYRFFLLSKGEFLSCFGSFRGVFVTFCHEIVQKISCGGNINLFGQIKTGNNLIWIIKTRDVTIFRMILGFPVQTNSRFVKSKTLQPVPQFMFYLFSSISQNDLFNELILPSTVELVMVLGLG